MKRKVIHRDVVLENLKGFVRKGSEITEPEFISTGHFALDLAIAHGLTADKVDLDTSDFDISNLGGLPLGKLVEIYGTEGCLGGDTFVQYEIRNKSGKRQNIKGGTIRDLYHRFNRIHRGGRGSYQRKTTLESDFFVSSVNEEDRIFKNRVMGVVKTGEKECFQITTENGSQITATADHKFYNGDSYVALSELLVGDKVGIHNNTPFSKNETNKPVERKYLYVKHHGVAGNKVIDGKYQYRRLLRSRAVIEAEMNNLSLGVYVDKLNSDAVGLKFLPRHIQVHHKDENILNDERSNLVLLDPSIHARQHAMERHNNLRFQIVWEKISDIKSIGVRETYDIQMDSPFNNFVANNFVVHNSGKSSIAYRVVGFAQKLGYNCLWIDAENSFSPDLADINGVDKVALGVSELYDEDDPDKVFYAEDIMENICTSCKSGYQVIVLDSVAALTTKAEMENDIGKGGVGMGALAQLMARSVKKVCNYAAKYNVLVIMINQVREKIGCFAGNTKIRLADGSTANISRVIRNQEKEVMTVSQDGEVQKARIINHFDNGLVDKMLHIQVAGGKNGKRALTCTVNHRIFCPSGEKYAGDLLVGDEVLVLSKKLFSEDQMKIVFGSILGDGSLRYEKGSQRATLRLGHGIKQYEYCQWKAQSLSDGAKLRTTSRACYWESPRTEQFRLFSGMVKKKGVVSISDGLIHEIDGQVASIWYADDGTYSGSHTKWGYGKCEIAATKLDMQTLRNLQIHFETSGMGRPSIKVGRGLMWSGKQSQLFQFAIAPYLHPSMRYKIKDTNLPFQWEVKMADTAEVLVPAPIISIKAVGRRRRYDMEVENTHTYFASDVLVHNCMFGDPESTPGGRALKFHASIRLRFQKQTSKEGQVLVEKDDGSENLIAGKSYVQIKKNRFGKPVAESILIPIYYEKYFPDIEEILFDAGRITKLISVRKGVFTWDAGAYGTVKQEGRNAFVAEVKEKKLVAQLVDAVKAEAKELGVLLAPEVYAYESKEVKEAKEVASEIKVPRKRKAKNSTSEPSEPVEAGGEENA